MGANRMPAAAAAVLIAFSRPLEEDYPSDFEGRRQMVESVQDYIYRLRPIAEWTPMDGEHSDTTSWLLFIIDTLAVFRREHAGLVRACQPVKRRIATGGDRLEGWLQSGFRDMALRRAQFLPLGPSAIMHRFVCPSPARDCLLIVRPRGYLTRALNSYCIGQAGAQFRTQWPHSAFALEHDRRTDLTRILFLPRPADSNRMSVRAGRL